MMKNPLQNLSCKGKDLIFDDLGATNQSQKNSYWMQKLYVTVGRDTLFCEVGIWKRRREWRRKHWRIDSWLDETWKASQKLKPSQTFSLLFSSRTHTTNLATQPRTQTKIRSKSNVTPKPCALLLEMQGVTCLFPYDRLPLMMFRWRPVLTPTNPHPKKERPER